MLEYSEKRDHIRMTMDCEMQVHHPDKEITEKVHLEDLSATGMRFFTDHELKEGDVLEATVTPNNDITPPMQAQITVLRCQATETQGYDVAASISTIEPAEYPEKKSA